MRLRRLVVALASSISLVVVPAAAGKEFQPGDLRLCNAADCMPIVRQKPLDALSSLYYGLPRPRVALPPGLGVPYYELRFDNGYVTGIVATRALDRFLSYGVNLDQFTRGRWYRVPPRAAAELRRLARTLEPLRLTHSATRRSR